MSKIEMVLPTLEQAGMETIVVRLAIRLAKCGHDVGITCLESGGPLVSLLRDHGIVSTVIPTLGVRTNFHAPALDRWLSQRRPEVLHSHSGTWLKAVRAARRVGVAACVHTLHGLLDHEPWYSSTLMRLASRDTDVVTGVSRPLVDYVLKRSSRTPDSTCFVPNGVDIDRFLPPILSSGAVHPVRALLPESWRNCTVIGHVARLVPVKNQRVLLEAFHRVSVRIPDTRLAIIGDGPLQRELDSQCHRLGLTEKVLFVGAVSDVRPWLQEFDLFVLSSRAEGTSMSILEALSSGLCVVATDVGGNAALLSYGESGILVPSDDAAALADALIGAVNDDSRRRALAAAGRRHVEHCYSEQAMTDAYNRIYEQLIHKTAVNESPAR